MPNEVKIHMPLRYMNPLPSSRSRQITDQPRFLVQISGETIGDVIKVADMHDRKSEMAKHADAFIALPGETSVLFTRKDNAVMATLTNLNFLQVGMGQWRSYWR